MTPRLPASVRLFAAFAALLGWAAPPAHAQTDTTVTFQYPALPGGGALDDDGYLTPTDHTFQEGGMHVEGFWVRNNAPSFSPLGHLHIIYPNHWEQSHGFATAPGLGPDRQGLFVRREDGGPFDLRSLDYRLLQPAAANLLIGTDYDPALPATAQLTAYPVTAAPGFQPLAPTGFEGVTQLFLLWDLGTTTADRAEIDNLRLTIPHGSCSSAAPAGLVFTHTGQADPASEGFVAEGAGSGVASFPLSDGGVDAWAVDDDATTAGSSLSYTRRLPPDVMCWARTAGARVRAAIRVVDVPDAADGAVLLSYSDGQRLWEVRLGATATGSPIVWFAGAYLTLGAVPAGFHIYEIAYDPDTAAADLSVDGTEVIADRPGLVQSVSAPRVRFGSLYDFGAGRGHFASVEFELPHRCSNGVDDDGDSLVDHPADPGCGSPDDDTETAACANGLDDDGDGAADHPADAGCSDPEDDSELSPLIECDDGFDDDGDGLVDHPDDPGCSARSDPTETTTCSNGLDDDGDGLADYPADPGCADVNDASEGSLALACDDGLDNDSDGATDHPADLGCYAPDDPSETTACSNAVDDDGDGDVDSPEDPGCADALDDSERSDSLVCDDGLDNDGDGAGDWPADAGCSSLLDASETTACANGLDDDGDGASDTPDDPGCADALDDSERSELLACDDGLDNDGDGSADFPADPGCESLLDPAETAACSNGLDDDGDGAADHPADPGCAGADDASEHSPELPCDDGLDNDGDAHLDYPADVGCAGALAGSENPQCQDGFDNDFDGTTDFDGGAAANGGVPVQAPDPNCAGQPTRASEVPDPPAPGCGLGPELALLLPPLLALRRRRRAA